jgi:hypothetical protein
VTGGGPSGFRALSAPVPQRGSPSRRGRAIGQRCEACGSHSLRGRESIPLLRCSAVFARAFNAPPGVTSCDPIQSVPPRQTSRGGRAQREGWAWRVGPAQG